MEAFETVIIVTRIPLVCTRTRIPMRTKEINCYKNKKTNKQTGYKNNNTGAG